MLPFEEYGKRLNNIHFKIAMNKVVLNQKKYLGSNSTINERMG